jgi:hypothetical protein
MPDTEKWIPIAQAASRTGLDSTSIGRRARRGEFGRTDVRPHKGHLRRMITESGLKRWKERRKGTRRR